MSTNKKQKSLLLLVILTLLFISSLPLRTLAHHTWENVHATNIKANTATLNATILQAYDETSLDNYRFEYTTDPNFSSDINVVHIDDAISAGRDVKILKDISNLEANTTYYFRAWFYSWSLLSSDYHYSSIFSFTTNENGKVMATPIELSEYSLHNNIITLSISDGTYTSDVTDHIQLNNPPPGISLEKVTRLSDNVLYLTLNYDGTDFDMDYTNFTLTIKAGGFVGGKMQTSNTITVKALTEVDGYNTFISTGDSYPSKVEMTGYNIRDKRVHFNTLLHTEKVATNKAATFYYFATAYDQDGNNIGTLGDYENPLSITSSIGSQNVTVTDASISLSKQLTPAYRIVVIVKEVVLE